MNGMHGVSGNRAMPVNCGMQGMHGDTTATKAQKIDDVDTSQSTKLAKLSDETKGKIIDVQI